MDQKLIDDLKAKHTNLSLLTIDGMEFVFRTPTRPEFDRYMDSDKSQKGSAVARELAASVLVYPERNDLIATLDRKPGALLAKGGVLDTILDMAGLNEDVATAKKL